jgi:4-amino-4-deoxy-L-arabinose transferase-like glycosyltransferase
MKNIKANPSVVLFALIALYWFTRLNAIDSLAVFLDEANHMWWARDVWYLHPFRATVDGRVLNIWLIAAFYPFNAAVWTARFSVVTATTIGFASVLSTAQNYFSLRATVIAGLLYTFMPLTFFFERMALADSISAPFIALVIWMVSVKFMKAKTSRSQIVYGLLSGVILTAAILSKISNLIFLCVPSLAALLLTPLNDWRKSIKLAITAYIGCAITLGPVIWFLQYVVGSSMGLNLVGLKTGATIAELPSQILGTSQSVLNYIYFFMPFPMWLIAAIGIFFAMWKCGRIAWFNASVLVMTLGVLIVQTRPAYIASRFLPVYAPMIVILVGGGLAAITTRWQRAFAVLICILLIISGATFIGQAWIDPTRLSLGEDYWQYVTGWPTGYGVREVAFDFIKRDEKTQLVTLDLGSSQKLDSYLLGRTNKVTARWYKKDFPLAGEWLVIDMPIQDIELKQLNLQAIEVARYYRPGKESWISVYHVAP